MFQKMSAGQTLCLYELIWKEFMRAELYALIESMGDIVWRYPSEDLRQLGLELRIPSESPW